MQNSNRTILGLIVSFVIISAVWYIVLTFPDATKKEPLIFPALILFTALFVVALAMILFRSFIKKESFKQQQGEIDSNFKRTAVGKVILAGINSWNVDWQVLKVVLKKPLFFLPFFVSLLSIVLLGIWTIKLLIPDYLKIHPIDWSTVNFGNFVLVIIITFLAVSFICVSIYVLSYISLGYILRRKYFSVKENYFLNLVARYFKLFWFIILLSLTWIFLVFAGMGRRRSLASRVVGMAVTGSLSAFKFFLYINIVRVSMGEEKSSFKETFETLKKDAYQFLRFWFGSGLLLTGIWFLLFFVFMVLVRSSVIFIPTTYGPIIFLIAFVVPVCIIFAFRAFAQQIGIFSVYLKDKNNIDII
jgi:hypothetical protein